MQYREIWVHVSISFIERYATGCVTGHLCGEQQMETDENTDEPKIFRELPPNYNFE